MSSKINDFSADTLAIKSKLNSIYTQHARECTAYATLAQMYSIVQDKTEH